MNLIRLLVRASTIWHLIWRRNHLIILNSEKPFHMRLTRWYVEQLNGAGIQNSIISPEVFGYDEDAQD